MDREREADGATPGPPSGSPGPDGRRGSEDAPLGPEAHPADRLPEYVRGEASDAGAVEAHLAACERCRREVELLRALAAPGPALSPEARERAWRGFAAALPDPAAGGAARPAGTGGFGAGPASAAAEPAGSTWLSSAWKIAAAAAIVVMGLGVWQVNRQAAAGAGWNPTAAIRAWEADLADLRPAPEDVRLALGFEPEGAGVPWEALEGAEPPELRVPWEEGER